MLFRRILSATMFMLVFAIAQPARTAEKSSVTLAHIKLSGSLDEAPIGDDPLFGRLGENFKDKLDRIQKAKKDQAIQGLYLQIHGVHAGWGKLDELRRAIADFRKTGKKVFAFLESAEAKDYLLALACDEVCLPESGWLMLTGLRAEASFYKNLLDKIGVKADMLQMGDFKGAAEPYTRSSMSPQCRKQFEMVLDDYFDNSLVATIVEARQEKHWTADKVKKLIDEGPYTARAAQTAGLIHRVGYSDDYLKTIQNQLQAKEIHVSKDYAQAKSQDLSLSSPLDLLKQLLNVPKGSKNDNAKVAVIYAVGVITSGKSSNTPFFAQTVGSTTMIKAIRQAEKDPTVKAIVLRVDSPGGSALASDLIWNELQKCKKPVIASMSDVAASGGYYISMAARQIYAEPGTLTGSIGVIGGKMVVAGLKDKIGLKTEIISRGANSGILSLSTPFSDSERKAMTALMKDVYDQFLTKALAGREKAGKAMKREDLEQLAGGRIWTGRQAKANGLVDELGTLDDAIAAAWKMAGMNAGTQPELLILPKPLNFLEMLDSLFSTRSPVLQSLPLAREIPEVAGAISAAGSLLHLRREPIWVLLPWHLQIQ